MSSQHSGNVLNQINFEEHDGTLNAKKVSLVSAATIFAVVDLIGADAVGINGNVTLDPGSRTGILGNLTLSDPKGFIGLVTVGNTVSTTFAGNVTLDAGSKTQISGNVTLSDSKGFIGLTTVVQGTTPWSSSIVGNVTLSGTANVAVLGNLTLSDPKGFIGLTSVSGFANPMPVLHTGAGNVTLSDSKTGIGLVSVFGGSIGIVGNVTLSGTANVAVIGNVTISGTANVAPIGNITITDSKGFIGLVTIGGMSQITLSDPKGFIGLVSIGNTVTVAAHGLTGNLTLDAGSKTGIVGNVTIDSGTITSITNPIALKGNVTLDVGSLVGLRGNVTLTDSKLFIGLVTVGGIGTVTLADPKGFIGLITIGGMSTVTLTDSKTYIGLVTSLNAYGSNSTILTGVISATGFTTVALPPSNTRFFIKNLHVSSLGRSEAELRSGATAIIPFTSLSTTSGFAAHYGELGLPTRAQNDALVWNLNGLATISYMINVRSEA